MVHRQNQHDPVPVSAVVMSADQVDDFKAFLTDLIDKKSPPPAVLDNNQFEKLISMLQPGYELATMYLAAYKQANAPIGQGGPDEAELARQRADLEKRQAEDRAKWDTRVTPAYEPRGPVAKEVDVAPPGMGPLGQRFVDTPPAVDQEIPASEAAFVPPAPAPVESPRVFEPLGMSDGSLPVSLRSAPYAPPPNKP